MKSGQVALIKRSSTINLASSHHSGSLHELKLERERNCQSVGGGGGGEQTTTPSSNNIATSQATTLRNQQKQPASVIGPKQQENSSGVQAKIDFLAQTFAKNSTEQQAATSDATKRGGQVRPASSSSSSVLLAHKQDKPVVHFAHGSKLHSGAHNQSRPLAGAAAAALASNGPQQQQPPPPLVGFKTPKPRSTDSNVNQLNSTNNKMPQAARINRPRPANSNDSASLVLSSDQCQVEGQERDPADRPNCLQVLKKLFYSLLLCSLIALCWMIIIHTLKWIAIKGNELDQLAQIGSSSPLQQLQSASASASVSLGATRPLISILSNPPTFGAMPLASSSSSTSLQASSRQSGDDLAPDDAAADHEPPPAHHTDGLLTVAEESGEPPPLSSQAHAARDKEPNVIQLQRGKPVKREPAPDLPTETNADNGAAATWKQAAGRPVNATTTTNDDQVKMLLKNRRKRIRHNNNANAPTTTTTLPLAELNPSQHKQPTSEKQLPVVGGPSEAVEAKSWRQADAMQLQKSNANLQQRPGHQSSSSSTTIVRPTKRSQQFKKYPTNNSSSSNETNLNPNLKQADHQLTRRRTDLANEQADDQFATTTTTTPVVGLDSNSDLAAPTPAVLVEEELDDEEPVAGPHGASPNDNIDSTSGVISGQYSPPATRTSDDQPLVALSIPMGRAPLGPPNKSSILGRAAEPPAEPMLYRAPFFTSWFISCWNMLFMPVFTLISSCCFRGEDSTTKRLLVRESISQFMDNGLTTLQFLVRCALFAFLWMATIFGLVYSVSHLDATAVMALFSFSSSLTYFLSWVILHQQFVGIRIVAVIICTTGIALLAYMDNSRYLGSVLIVTGSAFYSAIYKVLYQRMFGFWSIAQMSLFFTIIGLFNALIIWPFVLLFYFLGIEIIVWRHIPWMHLSAAGALQLTANVVSYIGPICCYDIFLTLGLLVAVILSAVIDVSFYRVVFAGMKMGGIMLLMIGFLVCMLPDNWNEYIQKLFRNQVDAFKRRKSMKKSGNKVQDMSTGQISRLRTASGRVK